MSNVDQVLRELVVANRILAREDVVDAYGHVSVRHPRNPKRFFMARLVAPEMVQRRDIMELDLEGNPQGGDTRKPCLERFIHGSVYEARPEIQAVVHAHSEDVLPFTIADGTPMRPVIHSGSFIGSLVPVWDIRDRFGDTNLLVTNVSQGRDLAECLAGNSVALMRGHGFVAAARSLIEVVRLSVYLPRNARALMGAMRVGGKITFLSGGEIAARNADYTPYAPQTWRAWEYWAMRAGCRHLIGKRPEGPKPKKTR
jgi:ribulose-5-phosphate 4-epimerase/fuculose-1-phosphate aldolase